MQFYNLIYHWSTLILSYNQHSFNPIMVFFQYYQIINILITFPNTSNHMLPNIKYSPSTGSWIAARTENFASQTWEARPPMHSSAWETQLGKAWGISWSQEALYQGRKARKHQSWNNFRDTECGDKFEDMECGDTAFQVLERTKVGQMVQNRECNSIFSLHWDLRMSGAQSKAWIPSSLPWCGRSLDKE